MNREQVSKILERIQANRQFFLITNSVVEEWYRVLEPYDYEDVDNKLDTYFRDSDNFGKCPDVYYITKYLKTTEEKANDTVLKTVCPFCKRKIIYDEYHEHYEKCSSIDYLIEMAKRYLHKTLDRNKLIDEEETIFKKDYYSTCKLIHSKMPDGFPKHLLENVIRTYEGKEPKLGYSSVKEEVSIYDSFD